MATTRSWEKNLVRRSPSVIQRAYSTWSHLGQKNSFRVICDHYHRLDKFVGRDATKRKTLSTACSSSRHRSPPSLSRTTATYTASRSTRGLRIVAMSRQTPRTSGATTMSSPVKSDL